MFKESKDIIIIIPGNPGIKEYYDDFVDKLYYELKFKNQNYSIIVNGHMGHHNVCHDKLYSLHNQINYHMKSVLDMIQPNRKIILIGHSIGCYIILQLLRNPIIKQNISNICLLFPTIENMAQTPKGKSLSFVLKSSFLRWFIYFIMIILSTLTSFNMRLKIIKWYFGKNVHNSAVNATLILISSRVIQQVLYMAMTELNDVNEFIDWDVLVDICHKTFIYYGRHDDWCPTALYHNMRKRYLNAKLPVDNIVLDDQNMEHAFVLRYSHKMAAICADYI